jgi:porin
MNARGDHVEWEIGNWDLTAVFMNIGENDDGSSYNYFAAQTGYKLNTSLGEGNYRLIADATSKEFFDKDGKKESRLAVGISFDQELSEIFGAWIRCFWQDDRALIDYDALFSGGVNITGQWYGRREDNIGIGYAYLNGADDGDFDHSQVAEFYWRFALNDFIALTADAQYTKDEFKTDEDDIEGFIFGIRGSVEF